LGFRVSSSTRNSKQETRNSLMSRARSFFLRTPPNHGAHVAWCTGFCQRRLEDLMNLRILVFVFDLITPLLHVYLDGLFVSQCYKPVAPAIPAQGEVASGIGTGVKMLVKPLVRRNHDTSRFPVDPDHFAILRPKKRVALTA